MAWKNQGRRVMLSDRLRNMRFMREREETDLRSKLEEEQMEREKAAHWTLETDQPNEDDRDSTPVVIVEETYTSPLSTTCAGRQSFGKFNVAVEKRNRVTAAGDDSSKRKSETRPSGKKFEPSAVADIVASEPPLASPTSNLQKAGIRKLPTGKRSFKSSQTSARKRTKIHHNPNLLKR